ncbi:hypothetical protein ABFS83_10G066600 [Erythranthe nasuta]
MADSAKQISGQKGAINFEGTKQNGVVGLGILAALDDDRRQLDPVFTSGGRTAAVVAISPRSSSSSPIPILNKKDFSVNGGGAEDMELCEEYTCVISHDGENLVKKREYFEAGVLGDDSGPHKASAVVVTGNGGGGGDFLNSCFLCEKRLDGLDIFMYRGEKAFCSAECRYRQISIDEQNEKSCRSAAKKKREYSVSPCSGKLQFIAGVAAA